METTHESSRQTLRSAQPSKPYAFSRKVFCEGMRDGVPIALGYFAVSFSLGIAARTAGFTCLLYTSACPERVSLPFVSLRFR